ncbi:hypothetical protein KIH74_06885 [Kineosporia sp. J2-2]|uniref:Immunity protein Imm1 n=1 Tax=Kineosporia corallincola TaxID=2835133 RepID=A0ABS5TC45_9ACTN|nr:Imm1 family immunity protein [Kineosporia corallincola]MBT0768645.1 hypothetical protein [Kineosporia corallincola]
MTSTPSEASSATGRNGGGRRSPLMLQWSRDESSGMPLEALVADRSELAAVLARIQAQAGQEGIGSMVHVWAPGTLHDVGPGPQEPEVHIETVIGDPAGAGLRWLGEVDALQAFNPDRIAPQGPITFDNCGNADEFPPSVFRLTLTDVQDILTEYLETGNRTATLAWTSLAFMGDPEP